MTALAISWAVAILGWKAMDVWANRARADAEGIAAMAARVDEVDDAGAELHAQVRLRLEELETRIERFELERLGL